MTEGLVDLNDEKEGRHIRVASRENELRVTRNRAWLKVLLRDGYYTYL